jgi:hypothetical protein
MAKVKISFNSFQFGELSPSFLSRVDTQLYQAGAQKVRNFLILNEGGIKKRPGTEYIYQFGTTRNAANEMEIRIEPFVFSDDERYIFAFSNNKLEVFGVTAAGVVDTSPAVTLTNGASSNVCPWTTAKLKQITIATSADIMIVSHTSFNPVIIRRTGSDAFEARNFTFDVDVLDSNVSAPKQPYYDFQAQAVTITPSVFTAGVGRTLTTSSDYFTVGNGENWVGKFILVGSVPCEITARNSNTEVVVDIPTGGIYRELPPDSIEVFGGIDDVRVTMALHNLSVGDSFDITRVGPLGGISASNIEGTFTVTQILDENTFEYATNHNANTSSIGGGSVRVATTSATTEWYEQSYSDIRGFPGAVVFHEGRLWFGGTTSQPDHIWASKSNDIFNFNIGTGADNDAIDAASNFGEFSQIRHLVSNRDLQIFSASNESYIPAFTEKPITPSNVQIKRQTPFGSSFARPQAFDGATLYTQASGKMLGSYVYSEVEQAYNTQNVSQTAGHLMIDPVQAASIKGAFDRAESYLFLINPDGTLSVFYSSRGDQKAGWMLWDTPGEFHSICTLDRQLFCVSVRDEGDGTNGYYLEEFKESMPMDFCKSYSGTAGVFDVSSVFANGANVKVASGTDYLGTYTVASGNVDTSAVQQATTAFIGYQFNPILKTLPIDQLVQGDSMTGRPRKIDMVTLDLLETLSVAVNNKNMILRNVNDDFSLGRASFTGYKEFRLIGISRSPTVEITQSVPFDLQLNGMVVEVSF